MTTDIGELERAAQRCRQQAERVRSRAVIMRALATPSWEGPGAASAQEMAAQRWMALVRVADQLDRLADRLQRLAWEVKPA